MSKKLPGNIGPFGLLCPKPSKRASTKKRRTDKTYTVRLANALLRAVKILQKRGRLPVKLERALLKFDADVKNLQAEIELAIDVGIASKICGAPLKTRKSGNDDDNDSAFTLVAERRRIPEPLVRKTYYKHSRKLAEAELRLKEEFPLFKKTPPKEST
jgi:hypothetical protein